MIERKDLGSGEEGGRGRGGKLAAAQRSNGLSITCFGEAWWSASEVEGKTNHTF